MQNMAKAQGEKIKFVPFHEIGLLVAVTSKSDKYEDSGSKLKTYFYEPLAVAPKQTTRLFMGETISANV